MIIPQLATVITFYRNVPSSTDGAYIPVEDCNIVKTVLDTFSNEEIKEGDKVFFTKSSKVPRYKFTQWTSDKTIARTIKPDQADVLVVNREYMVGNINGTTSEITFIKFPKSILGHLAKPEWPDTLFMQSYNAPSLSSNTGVDISPYVNNKFDVMWSWSPAVLEKAVEDYNAVYRNMNSKRIVLDEWLLPKINEGIVVDVQVFNQLEDMIRSGEDGNIQLAMELMANTDYEQSKTKLALLLNKYNTVLNSHKGYKLVNFKSMLEYLKKDNLASMWGISQQQFASQLVRTTTTSDWEANDRMILAKQSMLKMVNDTLRGTPFQVDEIHVTK